MPESPHPVAASNRTPREAAVRQFSKALKLDPRLAAAYHNRATAYQHLDRLDEAPADFETAVRLNPGLVDAALGRGEVFLRRPIPESLGARVLRP